MPKVDLDKFSKKQLKELQESISKELSERLIKASKLSTGDRVHEMNDLRKNPMTVKEISTSGSGAFVLVELEDPKKRPYPGAKKKYPIEHLIKIKTEGKPSGAFDPPNSPMFKEQGRFLQGNKIRSSGVETDSQQEKFYSAEREAWKSYKEAGFEPVRFDSKEEIQSYVDKVLKSSWWCRRFRLRAVDVELNGEGQRSTAWGPSLDRNARIRISKGSHHQEWVVLHELVHLVVPDPHAHHGRLFARLMLEVIKWKMGDEAANHLKQSYRNLNVKFNPRSKVNLPKR